MHLVPTSYRESNPSNFLCVSVFIPKKHLSSILRKMLLKCFFGIKNTPALFLLLGVYVGGFVGMEVLGCGKKVLGVLAAKTTIERF